MTSTSATPQDDTSTITDGTLGSLPTKILRHGANGAQAEIALRGATVLSWQAPWHGRLEDLTDGYRSEDELAAQHGGRAAVLFPFANRLRDNRYTFDGVTHEVGLQFPVDKEVIHGSARMADWTVVNENIDAEGNPSVTLSHSIRPEDRAEYPFAVDATLRFTLTPTSLDLVLTSRNVGDTDAPVAAGWHPYFRLPGHPTIDTLALRIPARAAVVTDSTLIPLAGAAAYEERDADVVHEALAGVSYDHAWDRLVPDADGVVRTVLTDPATGDGVAVWQKSGTLLVFTSDTLDRLRQSVAIESLETTTDAFNRPDREQDVRLAAGQERTFEFGAQVVVGDVV